MYSSLIIGYFNSPSDWLIIAGVVVLLFGGAKIPELARGVGEGLREFKKSVAEHESPTASDAAAPPPDEEVSSGTD